MVLKAIALVVSGFSLGFAVCNLVWSYIDSDSTSSKKKRKDRKDQ